MSIACFSCAFETSLFFFLCSQHLTSCRPITPVLHKGVVLKAERCNELSPHEGCEGKGEDMGRKEIGVGMKMQSD